MCSVHSVHCAVCSVLVLVLAFDYLLASPASVWASLECCPGITCHGTSINWNKFGRTVFSRTVFTWVIGRVEKWDNPCDVDGYLHAFLFDKCENVIQAAKICILTPPNVIWRCSIKWKIGCFVRESLRCGYMATLSVHYCRLSQWDTWLHNKTNFNTNLKFILR